MTYVIGMPCYCADFFPSKMTECKGLLLLLDIPDCDEAILSTRQQDMRDLLIPIDRVKIVRSLRSVAQ